jgi:hypothetical protein
MPLKTDERRHLTPRPTTSGDDADRRPGCWAAALRILKCMAAYVLHKFDRVAEGSRAMWAGLVEGTASRAVDLVDVSDEGFN